jgi:hypothetical protein
MRTFIHRHYLLILCVCVGGGGGHALKVVCAHAHSRTHFKTLIFTQDQYAMTIRGQINVGNRTAVVTLTGPAGSGTIDSAAVRTEFLSNRRCMYVAAHYYLETSMRS